MRKKTFLLISLSFILLSSCINVINSPKPLASPSPNIDTKISDIKTHSSSTANSPIPSTSPSSNININENNLPIASRSPEGQVEMLTPPPPDYSRTI